MTFRFEMLVEFRQQRQRFVVFLLVHQQFCEAAPHIHQRRNQLERLVRPVDGRLGATDIRKAVGVSGKQVVSAFALADRRFELANGGLVVAIEMQGETVVRNRPAVVRAQLDVLRPVVLRAFPIPGAHALNGGLFELRGRLRLWWRWGTRAAGQCGGQCRADGCPRERPDGYAGETWKVRLVHGRPPVSPRRGW